MLKRELDSFYYQNNLVYSLTNKYLPGFYYRNRLVQQLSFLRFTKESTIPITLQNYWDDTNDSGYNSILLLTGRTRALLNNFLLQKSNGNTPLFDTYKGFSKTKGEPLLTKGLFCFN